MIMDIKILGSRAKSAARVLARADSTQKNRALEAIAQALNENTEKILSANKEDIERAKAAGMAPAMVDRLKLNPERINGMAEGVRQLVAAADPVGRVLYGETRPNGLKIRKVTVPLGVIAVIFEARPNVTADAAALCLKSGNAVILRGGKEAISSNIAIANIMREAVAQAGLPEDVISLVEDTSRDSATALMRMNEYVDVLIPRGGAGLIRAVVENSTVPVIETGTGNCHVYIDKAADIDMAAEIVFNAKTSRPSVCNACESLLVHQDIAELALIAVNEKLKEKNVEIRGDEAVCAILPDAVPATEEDFGKEFLDYITKYSPYAVKTDLSLGR